MFDAILVDAAIFLKASLPGVTTAGRLLGGAAPPHWFWLFGGAKILEVSLHGVKTQRWVGGGGWGRSPPPFANTFITDSEGAHMGFVFAARMIAAAILHSLKITRGCWRERNPSFANRQPV